jgi:hypothetical protein
LPPFRAQGLASGIRDAANVCWKIASVLTGQCHAQVLDTYHRERLPHVQAAMAAAEGMGAMICLRRPKLIWLLKNRLFALANAVGLFHRVVRYFTPAVVISCGVISRGRAGAAAAVGAPVPNASTSCLRHAPQPCFDELFWRARVGKLRWCIVVVHGDGDDDTVAAKSDRAQLDAVEIVSCERSSGMAAWLLSHGSRAAIVRCASP